MNKNKVKGMLLGTVAMAALAGGVAVPRTAHAFGCHPESRVELVVGPDGRPQPRVQIVIVCN